MSKDYYQYVKDFTATGQLFEYTEITNSAGITYKEFINAPKTLDYFELGYLHPETDWLVFNDEIPKQIQIKQKNCKCPLK